jgi:hypothetical protein
VHTVHDVREIDAHVLEHHVGIFGLYVLGMLFEYAHVAYDQMLYVGSQRAVRVAVRWKQADV